MRFSTSTFLLGLFASANAHFRLLYPPPRGAFVANIETEFCGGYPEVTTNRTVFPLTGGFFTISTGHPSFTVGAIISTVDNPNNFDNFSSNGQQQIVSPYAKEPEAGTFCIPFNITSAGIEGVIDSANVTVQIVFAGGDGNLYQCADLTLSSALTAPEGATCTNVTATESHDTASPTTTGTSFGVINKASAATAFLVSVARVAVALL